jgi:hypothetical protein
MRAIRARYDPYEQTRGRVEQLKSLGHSVDKVRLSPRVRSHMADVEKQGRIHYHGRDIYEYARGLSKRIRRPTSQRAIWFHRGERR